MNDNVDNLDPVDFYKNQLKQGIVDNSNKYFDDLVSKCKVDVEANKKTADKIKDYTKNNQTLINKIKNFKLGRGLLIFATIVGLITFIFGIILLVNKPASVIMPVVLIVVGLAVAVICLLIIFLVINRRLKELQDENSKVEDILKKLKAEANEQLRLLKNSFAFNDFNNICRESTSMFKLDDYLQTDKLLMLQSLFDYKEDFNDNESVYSIVSGDVATNPFLRVRVYRQTMKDKVYSGSRTVSYTVHYTDSQGKSRTRTESETLTAYVTRPVPIYSNSTFTIYGNNAADRLSFSRHPSGLGFNPSEKDVKKYVSSNAKDLKRMADNAIKQGSSFTALANEEFETIFKAYNRNNETQFRLLFTPLAQQNMLEIVKGDQGYGDDFSFYKKNKINIINSAHGGLVGDYNEYAYMNFYDVREMKNQFVSDIFNIFKSLYFELAPVLSIPLYQMTDAGKYDPKEEYEANITRMEAESLANHMNRNLFKHPDSATDAILRSDYVKSVGKSDVYKIKASTFSSTEYVEHVSVMARNGEFYSVPVHYYQYDPLEKESYILARQFDGDKNTFNKFTKSDEFSSNSDLIQSSMGRNKCFMGCILDDDTIEQEEDKISSQIDKFLDTINKD